MFCQAGLHPHRLLLLSTFLVFGYGGGHVMGLGEMTHAGTLEGTVHYQGQKPTPKVVKNQEHCGTEVVIQTISLHDIHGALGAAVVSVEGMKGEEFSAALTPKRPVLNTQCAFAPRIGLARQGQELEIRNQDPILHNTHIKHGKRTFLNVAQVPGGNPIVKRLKRSGLHTIRCDKHVFMEAYLHVFSHPFYALTNHTGTFRITDIPPGNHTIKVWHETLGVMEEVVKITAKGTVHVDFAYP
jgi:hypothetical protein